MTWRSQIYNPWCNERSLTINKNYVMDEIGVYRISQINYYSLDSCGAKSTVHSDLFIYACWTFIYQIMQIHWSDIHMERCPWFWLAELSYFRYMAMNNSCCTVYFSDKEIFLFPKRYAVESYPGRALPQFQFDHNNCPLQSGRELVAFNQMDWSVTAIGESIWLRPDEVRARIYDTIFFVIAIRTSS